MEKNNNKDLIHELINDVFNSILGASEAKAKSNQLFEELIQEKENFSNYSSYYFSLIHKKDLIYIQALLHVKDLMDSPNRYRYADIFMKGKGFYEIHLKTVFEKFEGSICCVDRARTIINRYLHYLATGEVIEFDTSLRCSFPSVGDAMFWFDFMDSLYKLYYGKNEKYFEKYFEISKMYDDFKEKK
ncbi:MAG: hypothetical protein JHC31_14205 [Sulfurihydrogenibium sp.]|jgi:hypothetical protein|nr:hypothetical protein [Sulfurihydrogenibium sp.]